MTIEEALDVLAGLQAGSRELARQALQHNPHNTIPRLLHIAGSQLPPPVSFAENNHLTATLALFLMGPVAVGFTYSVSTAVIIAVVGTGASACVYRAAPKWRARWQSSLPQAERRKEAARIFLQSWDDPRALGPVCRVLETYAAAYTIPPIPKRMLLNMLPKMTAADVRQLDSADRARLHSILKMDNALRHDDLLIAILRLVEQFGDLSAIRHVQSLAGAAVTTHHGRRVREAARRCSAALSERIQLERQGKTLLRPSDAPAGEGLLRPAEQGEGILLRPSGGAGESDPEHLLRVTNDG